MKISGANYRRNNRKKNSILIFIILYYNYQRSYYAKRRVYLIPLNERFVYIYIYNLNLENGSNDFHEIYYVEGFEGDKSIYLGFIFYFFTFCHTNVENEKNSLERLKLT